MGGGGVGSPPPSTPRSSHASSDPAPTTCRLRVCVGGVGEHQATARGRPVPRPAGTGPEAGTEEPPAGQRVREERSRASWAGKRTGRRGKCEVGRWKRR